MTDYILIGLEKRRTKLLNEMGVAEAKVGLLRSDIEHIDGAIRVYSATRVRVPRAKRVEVSRAALDVLRQASAPLTLRELARAVMALTGQDSHDQKKVTARMDRLRTALHRQRKNGVVRQIQGPGAFMLWEIEKD